MGWLPPDYIKYFRGGFASGLALFGHDVVLRKFISASAGTPEFGIGDKLCYQMRPARMELRQLTLEEIQMVGGQDIAGTYEVVSQMEVNRRDEVLYQGETYRFLSEPDHELVGDVLFWKGYIQRASVTGYWA